MTNIPIPTPDQSEPVAVHELTEIACPSCGTYEPTENRAGIRACPNCGYLCFDILWIDEDEVLMLTDLGPLDETGWLQLLARVDQEVMMTCCNP